MNPIRRIWCGLLFVVALCSPAPVRATTIDPLLMEQLILWSDFVGVVECEQAGGIVAEYRIIESWKGPPVGTRISIRVAVDYWGPQFPISLCGERYFITAFKEPPYRLVSTTVGGSVPLWWRQQPADYGLPLMQGRERLGIGEKEVARLTTFRTVSQTLLAMTPAEQEQTLLKALINKYVLGRRRGEESQDDKSKELRARFDKLTTAESMVDELIRLAAEDPQRWSWTAQMVLRQGGGAIALAQIEKLPADKLPWKPVAVNAFVMEIKGRLKPDVAQPPTETGETKEAEEEPTPTAAELAQLRQVMARGETKEEFGKAFQLLTRHDPASVGEYLRIWKNQNQDWRDANRGYVLGSNFAWRCGGPERKQHLTRLLEAEDAYIRVAAGVYLCFEDAEAGTAALQKLTSLPGDPGAWAALTLARRGQKDAVPRALEVFRALPPDQQSTRASMGGMPHRNLQLRMLILLSNAARAGGAPQPVASQALDGDDEDQRWEQLVQWWQQHNKTVVLRDPWLPELAKQKVD